MLAEKVKTLFREQGITIVSIITALGDVIATIVESIIGTGGGGSEGSSPTPEPPPSKGGVKGWILDTLKRLGKMLAWLADKTAGELPGITGTLVSWLFKTASSAVGWLAQNVWALWLTLTVTGS